MKNDYQELQSNQIVILGAILTVVVTVTSASGNFDFWDSIVGILALVFLLIYFKQANISSRSLLIFSMACAFCSIVIIAFPLRMVFLFKNNLNVLDCSFDDYKICAFQSTTFNSTRMNIFLSILIRNKNQL